jgi:hypothetical protein
MTTRKITEIEELLKREPFRPFQVTMNSGRNYPFMDPKDGLYLEKKGFVYWFGGTGPMAFFEEQEISSVEVL